jgi:acyl dehydratase
VSNDAAKTLTAADAVVGAKSPVYTVGPITRTDIVKYAGAGGDFNPIHHDEAWAVSIGLPSVFSMGLFQGGLSSRLASDWIGLKNLTSFGTRFRSQVWPGEILKIQGELTEVEPGPEGTKVKAKITVTNEDGTDVKIQAWATGVLAE